MPNTDVTLNFKADIKNLKSQIQEANRNIKLANAEFKAASTSMDFMADSADGIQKKLEQLNKVYKAQNTILDSYKKELELVVKEQGENSAAADNLRIQIANQQAAINKTAAEINKYENALEDVDKNIDNVADSTEEMAESTKDASEGFTVMKGVLADLAATAIKAVVQGLKDIGKAAMDAWQQFDEGVDTIIKKTGATGEAAKALETSFANVSKRIVADSSTIGNAMGELNTRFGYTGQELEDATVAFLKFSDVTGADAADAVADVAKALTAAGKDMGDYQQILDALTVAGQKSGVSVTKVADALTKYGAQTRALGMDIEEVVALFAQFESAGVNSEAAIAGIVKATGKWQAAGEDAEIALAATINAIRTETSELKAAELATEAFGNKAGPELADAIRSGRFEFSELTKAVKDSAGAVERTFDETQDAPDKLKLAVQSLKTDLAQTTNELLTEFAPDIEKALEKIGKALKNDIIPAIKNAIKWVKDNKTMILTTLSSIAAGLVALNVVKIITGLVNAFKAFKAAQEGATVAQWLLNAAMNANPIGIIIAAITALVTAFVVLWNKSEAFRDFFIGMWEVIKEDVGAVIDFLKALFVEAWGVIKDAWDGVVEFFKGVWDGIKNAFKTAKDWLSGVFTGAWDAVKDAWNTVKDFFSDIWEGIKDVFSGVGDFFKDVFEGAKNAIKTVWDGLAAIVKAPINVLIDGLNLFIKGLNKIQIPDWVPGVGGYGINIPTIPRLYRGGVLRQGQVGLLEGSGDEAVVPLSENKAWISAIAREMRRSMQAEGLAGNVGGTVINFNQTNTSPKALDQLAIYRATQRQLSMIKGVLQNA